MTITVTFRNVHQSSVFGAWVGYTGEQWRRSVSANVTTLRFEYKTDQDINWTPLLDQSFNS